MSPEEKILLESITASDMENLIWVYFELINKQAIATPWSFCFSTTVFLRNTFSKLKVTIMDSSYKSNLQKQLKSQSTSFQIISFIYYFYSHFFSSKNFISLFFKSSSKPQLPIISPLLSPSVQIVLSEILRSFPSFH